MKSKIRKKVIIESLADEVMAKHSIADFPNESCGFMYGHETEEERIISLAKPVVNSKEGDQRRRFEISPFDYMKAETYAIQHQISLLGVYHSHPQHPAIASSADLKSAMPYFSYVIYSVIDQQINDVKSWQLTETGEEFEEEFVEILNANKIKNKFQIKQITNNKIQNSKFRCFEG